MLMLPTRHGLTAAMTALATSIILYLLSAWARNPPKAAVKDQAVAMDGRKGRGPNSTCCLVRCISNYLAIQLAM